MMESKVLLSYTSVKFETIWVGRTEQAESLLV
jgi:hypothetical protein